MSYLAYLSSFTKNEKLLKTQVVDLELVSPYNPRNARVINGNTTQTEESVQCVQQASVSHSGMRVSPFSEYI